MADPLHARDLIVEDALQSRGGLMLDDEALIEQERELDEDLKHSTYSQSTSSSSSLTTIKGKGKKREEDDEDDRESTSLTPTSRRDGRGRGRAQAGYDALNGHREHNEDGRTVIYANGHTSAAAESSGAAAGQHRHHKTNIVNNGDKRRRRQSYTASTPTGHHNQQQLSYDDPFQQQQIRQYEEEDNRHSSSPFRDEEGRTTGRILGSLLSRDPIKELESSDGNSPAREKQLTKKDIRAAYWRSIFISCLFVLAWYMCSTLISLYNKWMFSPEHYGFGFPLFVTSCHMLVQFGLCSLVLSIFPSLRPSSKPKPRDYGTKVLPCGLATGLDIGLSNLSLKTITLSFYTMCKSSVLGFVLIWAFIFRLEKPTLPLIGIISIIIAGVIMMVSSETQFHMVGMIQVLTASCLSGLRWSLTQILLDKESMGMNNPFATLFWLAPIMGISLAICSIFIEGWFAVFSSEFFDGFDRCLVTAGVIILPGVIAFMMNVAEFGLIQRTSVVTLSVAGMFKEVITIFLSTVVFHDELTPINISGLCVAIIGIGLYNYLKYRNYKAMEKRVLQNGGSVADMHPHHGTSNADEAEMEALHPGSSSRSRRDHDGGQFQLVGEDDFDSSSESDNDEDKDHRAKYNNRTTSTSYGKMPYNNEDDGIERLPAYAETHPNVRNETLKLEEKVNHDPMLVDLEREEEQLEMEMDNTRHDDGQADRASGGSKTQAGGDLLFDAADGSEGDSRHR